MTPQENAKKYFDKYSKLKRTKEALDTLLQETGDEIKHLESIAASLDIASSEEDLIQIKEEMMEYGYVKRKNTGGGMDMISMSEKIIFRMTSFPLNLLPATTGGFTPKGSRDRM